LDFSSAYNTVLHSKLFQKLKKVLSHDEVQLIKAIYSRSRIRLGDQSFTPNIGVAQGSAISPALFKKYFEDLYQGVRDEQQQVNEDDLLRYADDMLILVTSIQQLRRVIWFIKAWCIENDLKINSSKSGIMEFVPRQGRNNYYLQVGTEVEGFPVVDRST